MSVPQSKVTVRHRLNVLCWCASEACKYNIRSAIVMAAAMTSCSTAILASKTIGYCRSCTCSIERFTSAFAGKVYEQMMALIQSRSLELHYQNF